uniref:Uncharacterized protein n=1 Tax=Parascaris univalens TaxID=6257 RepID=A0A915BQN2_PARUN
MDENVSYNAFGSQSHTFFDGDTNALFFRFRELGESYVQSRSSRIRAAMFPEMCTEEEQANEMFENRSCIVERLAEPSQLLKTAVVELLSVQDESEITTKAIPELVKLLSDKDETVVLRAAHMVHLLSKEDKSMAAIANNPSLVAALCSATRFDNEAIRKDALAALSHISEHAEGRVHLFRSGGIPELVRMLGVPVDAVRHYAITTLHNLLLYMEPAKQFSAFIVLEMRRFK